MNLIIFIKSFAPNKLIEQYEIMQTLLLLLILAGVIYVGKDVRKLSMTLQEAMDIMAAAGTQLDEISANLTEGFTEIMELIGQLQNTTLTPEQEAIVTTLRDKVTGVQPQARQIADIVPGPEKPAA